MMFALGTVAHPPRSSRSGRSLKSHVIRAMQEQFDAEREADEALDSMIEILRRAVSVPPPPRLESTRYRLKLDSAPDR